MRSVEVAAAAIFAAMASALTIFPIKIPSAWGMNLDLIGIPWLLCWMIFGVRPALLSVAISGVVVSFVGRGLWVGALAKIAATLWLIVVPEALRKLAKLERKAFLFKKGMAGLSFALGTAVRCVVMFFLNLYVFCPLYLGMSPQQILEAFGNFLGFQGWLGFFVLISVWNIMQSVLDIGVSWPVGAGTVKAFGIKAGS